MQDDYEEGELFTEQELLEMDLQMLREDLIDELKAINQYQDHINSLDNEQAIEVLQHIMNDEKEHVAELTKLLTSLDSGQAEKFRKEGL